MDTSFATEFPADNPLLGQGAAWVPSSPRGRALPTRRRMVLVTPLLLMPEGSVPPPYSLPAERVALPEPAAAPKAAAAAPAEPSPAAGPFEGFVRALAQVLLASGQTSAAAALPALFDSGSLRDGELPAEVVEVLRQRGVIEPGSLALTEAFRARATAWRSVLCGTSDDLGPCGDSTLDTWSSELLCALSAAPAARAGEYRRELRRRGVAAFGLIESAA